MEQKVELLPLTNDYVFKRVFTKDGEEGGKVEMAKEENEKVKEASEVLERMSMSYEERWLYDQRMLRNMDEMSLKEHARQERIRRTD